MWESSQIRDQTHVPCFSRRILTHCATREVEPFDTENICFVPRGRGFPGSASGEEPACQCRRYKRCRFDPWVRKIPWRRAWRPTLAFLPGGSHGQRSLVVYGPWGCRVRHDWSYSIHMYQAKAKFPFLTEFSVDFHAALCSHWLTSSWGFLPLWTELPHFPCPARGGALPHSAEGFFRLCWHTEPLSFVVGIRPEPRTPRHCHPHCPPATATHTGSMQGGHPPQGRPCGASVASLQSTDNDK